MTIEINEEDGSISTTLAFEKTTPGTVKYTEEGPKGGQITRTTYIVKEFATQLVKLAGNEGASPERIKVTIEAID